MPRAPRGSWNEEEPKGAATSLHEVVTGWEELANAPSVWDEATEEATYLPEKPRQRSASPAQAREPPRAPAPEPPAADASREQLLVTVEDDPYGDCPPPIASFEELTDLPEYVLRNLRDNGMQKPMPIQAQALPLVLAGRNVIGLAQTGSGKTLAFLLPIPVHLAALGVRQGKGRHETRALVLAPTRELAVQIKEQADKILSEADWRSGGVYNACLYGGGDRREQMQALRWGADLVVATPGRLNDFLAAESVWVDKVSYFVLDEADRMLDMGFQEEVASIGRQLMPQQQVLFFSATWNTTVQELAEGLCDGSKPVRISYAQGADEAGGEAAKHKAREEIIQEVIVVDHEGDDHWDTQGEWKRRVLEKHLEEVLEGSDENKILVFVSTKTFADEVSTRLWDAGFSADSMHGGKSQQQRLWALDQFRKGKLRLLVCTDVLGRGIDIPSVSHVVIYEMGAVEDYIHRIGRTARGRHGKGHALVFFEYWEGLPQVADELIGVLEASKQRVPEELRRIAWEVERGRRAVRRPAWSRR